MPSNLDKGLYRDTVGLLGGTGGAFLGPFPVTPEVPPVSPPLTWKLLVMRLMVELTPPLLSEEEETLGTTRWPPLDTMVEEDI